jgi:feruloyl esterase
VVAHMGSVERTHGFFRLFMVPGMGHCQGGAAPHAFGQAGVIPGMRDDAEHDIRRALEAWVERGKAPERIVEAAQVLQPYKMGEQ